jgi:hypothetical protein
MFDMAAINLEFELKLAGAPVDVRSALDSPAIRAALRGAISSERVVSHYYDDAKGSLVKNGASLRIRKDREGAVIVAKQAEDGSNARRIEVERPAGKPLRFSPLGVAAVDAVIASGAPLRRTGRIAFDRTSVEIVWEGARIELAADVGEARLAGRSRPISELEIELIDGPPDAVFSIARALVNEAAGRLSLRLAPKALPDAPYRAAALDPDRATTADALRRDLARAGVELERALVRLELRKPRACRKAARALRRVIDASELWGDGDGALRQLTDEARHGLDVFMRAERLRRLTRAPSAVNFGALMALAREDAFLHAQTVSFGLFRILLLEKSIVAPLRAPARLRRIAAAERLDEISAAVASATDNEDRARALARLASAARASAAFYPEGPHRSFRRLLRSALRAHKAADAANETCALAAEAAAGQGPVAARAAGFIAGAAAAEAAARLAAAPHACEALIAAPAFWREG